MTQMFVLSLRKEWLYYAVHKKRVYKFHRVYCESSYPSIRIFSSLKISLGYNSISLVSLWDHTYISEQCDTILLLFITVFLLDLITTCLVQIRNVERIWSWDEYSCSYCQWWQGMYFFWILRLRRSCVQLIHLICSASPANAVKNARRVVLLFV